MYYMLYHNEPEKQGEINQEPPGRGQRGRNSMNKIEEARRAAGLTMKKMSDLLEIPYRTVQNWENGVSTPPTYVERLVIRELERIQKEKEDEQKDSQE